MNSSAYHWPKLVSLAVLTTKGEEDGLEAGKPISSGACSESSPTRHPWGLAGLFFSSYLGREGLMLLLEGRSWCASRLAAARGWCESVSRHQQGQGEQPGGGCRLGGAVVGSRWGCVAKSLVAALSVAVGRPFIIRCATSHRSTAITGFLRLPNNVSCKLCLLS